MHKRHLFSGIFFASLILLAGCHDEKKQKKLQRQREEFALADGHRITMRFRYEVETGLALAAGGKFPALRVERGETYRVPLEIRSLGAKDSRVQVQCKIDVEPQDFASEVKISDDPCGEAIQLDSGTSRQLSMAVAVERVPSALKEDIVYLSITWQKAAKLAQN